jgi:drug/metabolite transporter (DMT)-like permease
MISLHVSLLSLICALLATSVGQLMFRMYYVHTKKLYLAFALGSFLAVPLFSYLALLNLTLAFVYMSTALIHVLVLIMAQMFLREHLTRRQYISISLIITGTLVFNF